MAKRKRLTAPQDGYLADLPGAAPETKSMFRQYRDGWEGVRSFVPPAPIAAVAGDAAAAAALDELSDTLARARAAGRMVLQLPLDQIDPGHLMRDRLIVDEAEMARLRESLRQRGQQSPIEVTEISGAGAGRYGLISGWRRWQALIALRDETGEARFDTVLALLRKPADAADAYLAMVEENEIRVGLSYYERARIVSKTVGQGVFDSHRQALQSLFHAASRSKRSKIGAYLPIIAALDGALAFPEALTERMGLILSKALEDDPDLGPRLRARLQARPASDAASDAAAEQALILAAMKETAAAPPQPAAAAVLGAPEPVEPAAEIEAAPGIRLGIGAGGSLHLHGPGVTPALRAALLDWLAGRG